MSQVLQAGTSANYITITQVAHGFSVGDPVYWDGTQYQLAIANSQVTSAMGVVATAETDAFNLIMNGAMRWVAHGIPVGEYRYLSTINAGGYINVPPVSSGDVTQAVLQATTADTVQVLSQGPLNTGGAVSDETVAQVVTQNGHGFTEGQSVFQNATGVWELASAQNSLRPKYALVSKPSTDAFVAIFYGRVEWTHGQTVGADFYLSTSGNFVEDRDTTVSNDIRVFRTITDSLVMVYDETDQFKSKIPSWSSTTTYRQSDLVFVPAYNTIYQSNTGHTSGISFQADYTSGLWSPLSGFVLTAPSSRGGLDSQNIDGQKLYVDSTNGPNGFRRVPLVPNEVTPKWYVDESQQANTKYVLQTAHGFALGDAIARDAGSYFLADANVATRLAEGVVSEVVDANQFVLTLSGDMDWPAHGLTLDAVYYVSATALGGISLNPAQGNGQFTQGIIDVFSANAVRVLANPAFGPY